MKAAEKKAAYTFRKSTIEDLAQDVERCQDALHVAMSVLQFNIGATTVEQLQKLDERLVASTATLDTALKDLRTAHDTAKDEIVQHLLQNRKMLEEEGNRRKAMDIVESLKYPEMNDREWQIHAADDLTLADLFVGEGSLSVILKSWICCHFWKPKEALGFSGYRVNNTKVTARNAAVATISSLAGRPGPCAHRLSFALEVCL